jgi:hypothetical protein
MTARAFTGQVFARFAAGNNPGGQVALCGTSIHVCASSTASPSPNSIK